MALKTILDSVEELDESLQSLYEEGDDGKFYLSIDGPPRGFVEKRKVDEFRNNNISLKKKLDDLTAKMQGVDPEEYTRIKDELDKLKDSKLWDEGKLEEIVERRTEKMRKHYDGQVKALQKNLDETTAKASGAEEKLSKLLIDASVSDAVTKIGVPNKGAMTDIFSRARQTWKIVDNQPVAMEGDEPIYGKDGKSPITMEEWAETLSESAPHLFQSSKGGGASGGDNLGAGVRVVSRSDLAAKAKAISDIASGKVVVK